MAFTNMIEEAMSVLADKMIQHASTSVTYAVGDDFVDVQAVLGSKLLKVDDGAGGFSIQYTDMDFLIRAVDLTLARIGGCEIVPEPGHLIYLPIANTVQLYEVVPYQTDPCWRWCDPYRKMRRIHTKHVEQDCTC